MEFRKTMIDGMVHELNCWSKEDLMEKTKELYRQELEMLPVKELMNKYNNLTFNCLEDGSPMP